MYLRGFRQLNIISKVNNYTRRPLQSQKLIPLFFAKRHFSRNFVSRDRFSDAEQQLTLGTQQLNQGSIDMAMNHYHKSVQLSPTPAGYFNIGVCYFQMGKHKDAIEAFKKSLQLDPNSADAHTNIASAYLMMSDISPAMDHLEKASNFNPLDGEIHYNLGCVYEATGNIDGAKIRLERARDLGIPQAAKALEKLNNKKK
ncbi:hypothetical protein BJ944DRAFT_271296 [Cunninghamella echinulata]|nr:hypothetical protein BJ944DRAFT_271296 [Cunninghamella echinulata]